jgi:hypothetical protein
MPTHTYSIAIAAGDPISTTRIAINAEGEDNRSVAVTNGAEPELDLTFVKARLKSFFAKSDAALTINTNANSGGTPQDAIVLAAGVPYFWYTGSGITNPFGGDVTKVFLDNNGAGTANVEIRTLVDPTP